jgi:hypothetical protein
MLGRTVPAPDFALIISRRPGMRMDPAVFAVRKAHPMLDVKRPARRDRAIRRSLETWAVIRVAGLQPAIAEALVSAEASQLEPALLDIEERPFFVTDPEDLRLVFGGGHHVVRCIFVGRVAHPDRVQHAAYNAS